MKFTLTCETASGEKVTHEFKANFLNETVIKVDQFLKGVGFSYGELQAVDKSSQSIFGSVVQDHYDMLNNFDNVMNIDLSSLDLDPYEIKIEPEPESECVGAGCSGCNCGKTNAN